MKTSASRLLSLLLAIMPMAAVSQTNIRTAFDAIIKCPEARITENHTLDKDPATNQKTGQSDVYHFVLPASKLNLVKKAISAFDKDSEIAYSINRGTTMKGDNDIFLAVGDASSNGICITGPEASYVYALFLPSLAEDPDGKYRYAYALSYKDTGSDIEGKLVVTYATTLKYRQEVERQRQSNFLRNLSGESVIITSTNSSQATWFDTLMSYFQGMTSANSQTRIALATKAYKLIRDSADYPDVTQSDKDAAREILKGMISDKKYSETVLNKLLNQCLASIR